MRLIDLEPHWINTGKDTPNIGISFLCPHCHLGRLAIYWSHPTEKDPSYAIHLNDILWKKTGDTFDTMTFDPSIDASKYGHWHGWIVKGEIR